VTFADSHMKATYTLNCPVYVHTSRVIATDYTHMFVCLMCMLHDISIHVKCIMVWSC